MEVVAHEKTAAQKEIAELSRLRVSQVPMPDFDSIEPRPVVDFVGIVGIYRLLDRRTASERCRSDRG
jgi:hypothetical protein